ncbi:MAG: hypothetical protein LBB63_02120 [Holosporaceae bacterium]|jgi:dihydrofolate synthase/folylpolyglutamate synthase|nr:hypothetical protein [Holosporaceae bacterium]
MTYEDIIHLLESSREYHDLDHLRSALAALRLEIDPSRVIIVAGTNGKGSTCAALQTLLLAAGRNVGFFSSPHLVKINERIKFNGQDVSDGEFCSLFWEVRERVGHLPLSHFEYLTLMAAHYFFRTHGGGIDFAIFEVGLGGALDATNVIPHGVSVITRLGLDHEIELGSRPKEIAANKFGIISPNNRVFHTKFRDSVVERLAREYAAKLPCDFAEACSYDFEVSRSGLRPTFRIGTEFGNFPMNLQGRRGAENAALAMTIFLHLLPDGRRFLPAIARVNWPGRMEAVVVDGVEVFLSGDHNPQGIESLLEILDHYEFEEVHFVVGIGREKNHREMLRMLSDRQNSHLYLTETPFKTLPLEDYDPKFAQRAAFRSKDPLETLRAALSRAKNHDLVVATGSLHLVGAIKALEKDNAHRRNSSSPV